MGQTVGASVIGSSHTRTGKPCQDAHAIQAFNDEVLLLAVADGLGSAEHSEIGSRLAADTVLSVLAASLPADDLSAEACLPMLETAFAAARSALEERAALEELELRDLGTTLICAVLAPQWVACAQIGDGAIVALQEDDSLLLLSSPQRGEYANETVPLTTQHALEKVRYNTQPVAVKALAAISDGLQNLALQGTEYVPFAQFFTPFFNLVGQSTDAQIAQTKIEDFLSSERVLGRTDDDKTLVLAVRCQAEDGDTLPVKIID